MDKYAYREYSKDYPRLFEIERDRLRWALEIPAQIEHIGSMAVVGLGGKGTLDVGIGVAPQDRSSAREQLSNAGREYRAKARAAKEAGGDGSKYIALKEIVLQKILRLATERSDEERKL